MKTTTEDPEIERAAHHLASMKQALVTLSSKNLRALLLKYDGRINSWGRLCDIKSKRIGPGVYHVWLEEWKGR